MPCGHCSARRLLPCRRNGDGPRHRRRNSGLQRSGPHPVPRSALPWRRAPRLPRDDRAHRTARIPSRVRLLDWRAASTPFESMANGRAWRLRPHRCQPGTPALRHCRFAPPATLGIQPIYGRNFTPAEDQPNVPRVALISYDSGAAASPVILPCWASRSRSMGSR